MGVGSRVSRFVCSSHTLFFLVQARFRLPAWSYSQSTHTLSRPLTHTHTHIKCTSLHINTLLFVAHVCLCLQISNYQKINYILITYSSRCLIATIPAQTRKAWSSKASFSHKPLTIKGIHFFFHCVRVHVCFLFTYINKEPPLSQVIVSHRHSLLH